MSFDSSRFTFNPWNDFLGVVMQQGRVQLDSDWNEWLAEFARRIQAGTMDTVGRAVVPATTPNGFKISATVDGSGQQHLTIGAGRMYVDGLMVENHGPAASAIWDAALAEMSGAPAAPPAVAEIDLDYTAQPYLPNAVLPKGPGPFLVYLDVWKRAITYLEHPELIDSAVGVDTTGRVQMVWQVKLLDVSNVSGVTCATPDSSIPSWESLIQPSGAQLTTAVVPVGYLRPLLPEYCYRLHRDGESALSRRNPSSGRRQYFRECFAGRGHLQMVARQCLRDHRRHCDQSRHQRRQQSD